MCGSVLHKNNSHPLLNFRVIALCFLYLKYGPSVYYSICARKTEINPYTFSRVYEYVLNSKFTIL